MFRLKNNITKYNFLVDKKQIVLNFPPLGDVEKQLHFGPYGCT